MRSRKAVVLFFLLPIYWSLGANLYGQSDSTVLTYQEFLDNVVRYHPLARKANLQFQLAEAERLAARGTLDPVLSSNWAEKNFDDKLYYRQYQGKLLIPTPLGIDLVGGYENNEGVFLNPEHTTDEFGLWNVGLEANILQGLWVNERRTALQQAEIFQNLASNEQQILLNDLLYHSSTAYLEWQQYTFFAEVLAENLSLAATYLENTKQSFFNGEKTAMDTLEAYILYQDAENLWNKNAAYLVKTRQNVENYLWFNDVPALLSPSAIPETYGNTILPDNFNPDISSVVNGHPWIQASINKIAYYEIEQRLKREKLKPKLKLKYNPLLATSEESIAPNYSLSNYKWGFDFSMPLLFRSERAAVQAGQIKLMELELELENKSNELRNKLEGSLQQQAILQQQLAVQRQNVEGYRLLLEGENQKFLFGESSVFLLNKRQEKYIDGQLKLIELSIQLQKEWLNYLLYSNGLN
ncbi:MAG TPA: TolC family protein [Saprospiraceae bacterium]|nr:TolC family protein [Saprospiraceae bacterium]HMQ83711.1 TolC family protein [Saprospiraceae bacterium]